MKFGGLEFSENLGGLEFVNIPCDKLPQDVASALETALNEPYVGATYRPIWYIGKQTVNGVNHVFLCEEIRVTKKQEKMIVILVVNVPPGERAFAGEGAKITKIVEEEPIDDEILSNFKIAAKSIIGVSYRAIMYFAKQIARGVNYYIIAEGKPLYPNAEPIAVIFCFNVFQNNVSVVSISHIETNGLLGYAFNWLKSSSEETTN